MSTLIEAFLWACGITVYAGLWACGITVYAGLILVIARFMSINRRR